MNLIKKVFIKNYKNTNDPKVRFKYGLVAGLIGILSNIILFVFKITVGILSHSITIIADAINNLSDAGTSIVTMVGFKLSSKPADKKHPFGHARIEYVTGLFVAILILVIGVLIFKSSIEKIITPEIIKIDIFTYIVLSCSIVLKIFQMLLYRNFSKSINSSALKASAVDSLNDIFITTAVLISTIIIDQTSVNIDAYVSMLISVFIIISSIKLIKETSDPIIGIKPDKKFVDSIKNYIESYEGVIGTHDLVVHNYGEGKCFVIAHVEVPKKVDIMESHDLIDNIEKDIMDELGVTLNIHMDPVDTEDKELDKLKIRAEKVIAEMDKSLSLHDFRIVRGKTHSNILFDVVIPFESKVTVEDIEERMYEEFEKDQTKYFFVIEMDRVYI